MGGVWKSLDFMQRSLIVSVKSGRFAEAAVIFPMPIYPDV